MRSRPAEQSPPKSNDKELGVVCAYFNYGGSAALRDNLQRFLAQFTRSDRVVVVECAFHDQAHEVDGAVQVRSNSVLFQKERLQMIGARKLIEEGFRNVLFTDADVIFNSRGWRTAIISALQHNKVIQAFDKSTSNWGDGEVREEPGSIRKFLEYDQTRLRDNNGFAWAVRADVLRQCPIYEHAIVGSGDRCLALGSLRKRMLESEWLNVVAEQVIFRQNDALRRHFIAWAERWSDCIGDEIGYARGVTLTALPHGSLAGRQYQARQALIADFDPVADVRHAQDGPLEWCSDKPEMHAAIVEYFVRRKD